MATMTGTMQFTGTVGELSAYRMKGSDKIIVRQKGGPTARQVKKGRNFELTRKNNKEFGGRSKMAAALRQVLQPLKHTADHDFNGRLNALMRVVQLQDTISELGERKLQLSACRYLPAGFNLNNHQAFTSLITAPTPVSLNRETGSAVIELPALIPGLNFKPAPKATFVRFTAVLGIVPDFAYNNRLRRYMPVMAEGGRQLQVAHTDWWPAINNYAGGSLQLQLDEPLHQSHTMVLSLGLETGIYLTENVIKQVKYAGCAKIMATA